jgi:hypothetical protein
MVSLAELDATELDTEEVAALAAEAAPASRAIAAAMRPAQPTLRSALTSAVWPLDILTGRLSTFLNGGRVR